MPLTHDHNATRRSETWVPGDPDLRDDGFDEDRAAWEKIPPSTMTNISKRVRRNMLKVIEQKGGNFYDE